MERLTKRSSIFKNKAVPSEKLGDLCMRMDFCDEFDFCIGCPVKKLIDRLCEYEDTGLTPKQIDKTKKSANINKCQRKGIVGVSKSGAKILFERVTLDGVTINGISYRIPSLIDGHCHEKVKIRIVDGIATAFDIETGEQIVWFELYSSEQIGSENSFKSYENLIEYGCTREMVAKALKHLKQIKK